jgi:trk system potassium uptake protein TrkH
MTTRIQKAIVASFAGLIATGTVLLMLPVSAVGPRLGFVEALFTSTSAVCVTGLTVFDPGTRLSPAGQFFLLALIQLGGLGILSLSGFVLAMVRQRDELSQRMYVETAHGGLRGVTPRSILRHAVATTALIEGIGALALFLGFGLRRDDFGLRTAWLAAFHSISSFCNAGFSLFPDNLESYRDDPIVNLAVMGLIVVGGIGFTVIADLARIRRLPRKNRAWWRLSLHTRMVLVVTGLLVAAGAAVFLFCEWTNSLRDAPWHGRVLAALFYSVTCRTAGFDTVLTGSLTSVTLLFGILLMFVGASPGGTGGGVKTSTAGILAASAWSRIRGRSATEFQGRAIPESTVAKAVATVASFVFLLLAANTALAIIEGGFASHHARPAPLLDYAFETTSAIGTVGLSTGITAGLSDPSKLVLILLMYLGRTGPLVVGASLIGLRKPKPYAYPQEDVLVG